MIWNWDCNILIFNDLIINNHHVSEQYSQFITWYMCFVGKVPFTVEKGTRLGRSGVYILRNVAILNPHDNRLKLKLYDFPSIHSIHLSCSICSKFCTKYGNHTAIPCTFLKKQLDNKENRNWWPKFLGFWGWCDFGWIPILQHTVNL